MLYGTRRPDTMNSSFPLQLLRGPFNFLVPREDEVERLFGDLGRSLPRPQTIFLEDEDSTPIAGFALLATPGLARLAQALEDHLLAEERDQVALCRRQPPDRAAHAATWERYRELLARAVENATLSSYGRSFPAIFWLHHSLDVARVLKETPRRVLRADTDVGRRQGDAIRYRVLERWLDRVLAEVYDLVTRLSADTEEVEEELFPRLLTRLRDNVLLLTEDHVGPDLAEIGGYFHGHLGIDGRDLRRRLDDTGAWLGDRLAADRDLAAVVHHLLAGGAAAAPSPRRLLLRPGFPTYLASRADYQAAARDGHLLAHDQVAVWESLLVKLKEFELVHALRRLVFPVERQGGQLVARGAAVRAASGRPEAVLSPTTRPLDFMAPWVVDPQVARFGLIYDITDFTERVSVLRRAGHDVQDAAFRGMFRLQRRIHRAAAARRLRLEKYLGDGAFYSGRFASQLLVTAIHAQRIYRRALAEGLPFDRGMRLALNFSEYRLLPIAGAGDERYEFFGHGVIELTRLTTGKATKEIDELKTMLLAIGYPEQAVHRFFAPLQREDRADHDDSRPFRARLDRNGHLVNEGIVATEAYVSELEGEVGGRPLGHVAEGDRGYVLLTLDEAGGPLTVGLRRLGVAGLKGLDRATVYEIVDAALLPADPVLVAAASLSEALDREVAGTLLEAAR
jgi:hypothetical protein